MGWDVGSHLLVFLHQCIVDFPYTSPMSLSARHCEREGFELLSCGRRSFAQARSPIPSERCMVAATG